MKYHQPFDQPLLPNAPYVNGNTTTGTPGSIPDAGAIEYPQREIVNAVTASGQTPDDGDLCQLTRAIRGGQLDYAADTGSTDALLISFPLAHNAIKAGLPFTIFKGPNANGTAAPKLTVTGPSGTSPLTGTLVRKDGSPLAIGDLPGNAFFQVRADAAGNFRVLTGLSSDVSVVVQALFIITTAITKTIGTDFPTLAAAFAWVSAYTITASGSVTINVPVGQIVAAASTTVALNHPNGNRIFIVGAALKAAAPVPNSFSASGNSPAARASDRTTNLVGLRSLYGSELTCTGGGGLVFGASISITNVLVTGDTATNPGLGGDLITIQGGSTSLTNVTVGAAGGRGVLVTQNGSLSAANSHTFGCVGAGWSVEEGGRLIGLLALGAFGNGGSNVNANGTAAIYMDQSAGAASIISRCSGGGAVVASGASTINCGPAAILYQSQVGAQASDKSFIKADGAVASSNTSHGLYAIDGSTISALNTSGGSNGGFGSAATVGSTIYATGATVTGASGTATPAVNTVGNQNSIVAQ